MMDVCTEYEASLLSESTQGKRDSDTADNPEKKLRRKRRSSLASTRRSISGITNPREYGSDLPSSGSSAASSATTGCGSQGETLKLNPLNIRMDEIIGQFEAHTSRISQENSQWKTILSNLEKEEEATKLLSESTLGIQASDIPQELKDLARSDYITAEMTNLKAVKDLADKRLKKTYFNMERCLQDMRLCKEFVNTIKCHNGLVKASLSNQLEDSILSHRCDEATDPSDPDIHSQVVWLMNN